MLRQSAALPLLWRFLMATVGGICGFKRYHNWKVWLLEFFRSQSFFVLFHQLGKGFTWASSSGSALVSNNSDLCKLSETR
jgi:hypothetical protein